MLSQIGLDISKVKIDDINSQKTDNRVKNITDSMKIAASEALATHVGSPSVDQILPDPLDKTVAKIIAKAIS